VGHHPKVPGFDNSENQIPEQTLWQQNPAGPEIDRWDLVPYYQLATVLFCIFVMMVSKEQLKKEVDKLPESLLDQAYALIRKLAAQKPKSTVKISTRNFRGLLDHKDIRKEAYE
jgi:hypothetical protein